MPPYNGFCAKCLRRRAINEMSIEANERSGAYGYYVCSGTYSEGGCYDGPYPTGADHPTPENDGTAPVEHLLHINFGGNL